MEARILSRKRDEAFGRYYQKKEAQRNELLRQVEWCRSEIQAGHHIIRNQFKLLNIGKRLGRLR
jgi:hypothetical protein